MSMKCKNDGFAECHLAKYFFCTRTIIHSMNACTARENIVISLCIDFHTTHFQLICGACEWARFYSLPYTKFVWTHWTACTEIEIIRFAMISRTQSRFQSDILIYIYRSRYRLPFVFTLWVLHISCIAMNLWLNTQYSQPFGLPFFSRKSFHTRNWKASMRANEGRENIMKRTEGLTTQ